VFIVFLGIFVHIFAPILVEASPIPNAFINEIHYDNIGKDVDEIIEIAGDGNLDLTGWSLHLYNGTNGREYKSFNLDNWSTIDSSNFGFLAIKTNGLQNGSPDGVVLSDGVSFLQFLSYEGAFTATSGIARGLTSIDIGVIETPNTQLGLSLQLIGRGNQYSDFTWASPQNNTFGGVNFQQRFMVENVSSVSVNEPTSLPLFFLALLLLLSGILKQYRQST